MVKISTYGTVVLDCDGVLLNYRNAYPRAWHRAFGAWPALKDPDAYFPHHVWDTPWLPPGSDLNKFKAAFDEEFWSSLKPMPGALAACELLVEAGFELVCVTALDARFQAARQKNLQNLGFPLKRVIATGSKSKNGISPKARAILDHPGAVAFVDDYAPYFRGIDRVHRALIHGAPNGSPNVGPDAGLAHTSHKDLYEFARWWINQTFG